MPASRPMARTGPIEKWPGFDQIAQGMGGLMSVTGLPGQGPVRAGAAVADMTAGLFAALGVMVALLEREKSGEGQYVETSLLAAQIFMLDFQAARWLIDKVVPRPGRQQSSDLDPDRRLQDQGRPHQHRDHRLADLEAVLQGDRCRASDAASGLCEQRSALEEPRPAECGYRDGAGEARPASTGSRS